MATYTTYTTIEGDRWDTVAWKAYGDATRYPEIAAANRTIPLDDVLPAGTILQIPIADVVTLDVSLLPPWKR
jgi:nucleoid-associated protein YgaU